MLRSRFRHGADLWENRQWSMPEGWFEQDSLKRRVSQGLGVLLSLWVMGQASQQCSGCSTLKKRGPPFWGLKRRHFWCRGDDCDSPASIRSSFADSVHHHRRSNKRYFPITAQLRRRTKEHTSKTLLPVCGHLPCRCFCLSFCSHSVDGEEQAHENAHQQL